MLQVQRGENFYYPNSIYIWSLGMKIPEWLSDVAKISFIDGEGNITLGMRDTNINGVEILDVSGSKVLITLKSKGDYICKDVNSSNIFTLSPIQLKLLYR